MPKYNRWVVPIFKIINTGNTNMNYKKAHDLIISRSIPREHNPLIHQRHHIIPLNEDPDSVDCVSLTLKEHRVIHFLRYKMGCGIGNKIAYSFMQIKYTENQIKEICSSAGKKGGKITRETSSGIFSEKWNRSKETSRRHEVGILVPHINKDNARQMGILSRDSGMGIYSESYDRSAATKKIWSSGVWDWKKEILRQQAEAAGKSSFRKAAGFHGLSESCRKRNAAKGGKITGKLPCWTNGTQNKKQLDCPGEGWFRGRTMKHRTTKQITVYKMGE